MKDDQKQDRMSGPPPLVKAKLEKRWIQKRWVRNHSEISGIDYKCKNDQEVRPHMKHHEQALAL
jgi:hypothetical protein